MDDLEQIVKAYTTNLKQEILNMLTNELSKKIRFSIGSNLTGLILRYQRTILEKPVGKESIDVDEDEIEYILGRVAKKRALFFEFDQLEDKAFIMTLCRDDGHGEDASAVLTDNTGKLKGVIVCDGVSESKGKFAAQYMVNAFVRGFKEYIYKNDPEELETFLDELLYESARKMKLEASRRGIETSSTTLLVGLTDGRRLYLYYLGDGFIYYYNHRAEKIMPYMIRYKKGLLLSGFISVKSGVVSRPIFLTIENSSPEGDVLVITTDGVMLSPQEDRERYRMFSRMIKAIASKGEDPIKLFAYLLATIGEEAPDDATIGVIGIKPKNIEIRIDYRDTIERIIKNPPFIVKRKAKTTKKPWEIESTAQQRRTILTSRKPTPAEYRTFYDKPLESRIKGLGATVGGSDKTRTLVVSAFIMGDVLEKLYNKTYKVEKFGGQTYLEAFLIRMIDNIREYSGDNGFDKILFFVDRVYPYRPIGCRQNEICISDLAGFSGLNRKISIDRKGLLDVLNNRRYGRIANRLFKAANVYSGIKTMAEIIDANMVFLFIIIGSERDLTKIDVPILWAFKQLVLSKITTILFVLDAKGLRSLTNKLREHVNKETRMFDKYVSIRKVEWGEIETFCRTGQGTFGFMLKAYISKYSGQDKIGL